MGDCTKEHFTADELRLLQNVLNTDRRTIDYIEGVVSGLDMTERRATAGVMVMKVRRLLDRELSDELEDRKRQLEELKARAAADLLPPVEPQKTGPLGIVPAAALPAEEPPPVDPLAAPPAEPPAVAGPGDQG